MLNKHVVCFAPEMPRNFKANNQQPPAGVLPVSLHSVFFLVIAWVSTFLLFCYRFTRASPFYFFPPPPPAPRAATSVANCPHALDSSLPRGVLTKVGHPPCVRTWA